VHTEVSDEAANARRIFEQAGAEDIAIADEAVPEPESDTSHFFAHRH